MNDAVDKTVSARKALWLAEQIKPLLSGLEPEIQSGALCELMALFVVAHIAPGDPAATAEARKDILDSWIEALKALIEINAEMRDKEVRSGKH